jgi:hypothetical protein
MAASSSAVISPGRATRCTAGRSLSASNADFSSSPVSPSASANARATHLGCAERMATLPMASLSGSGARRAIHASSSNSDTLRSTAFTNPLAREPCSDRTRSTVDATAACCGIRVRSSW